MAVGAGVRDILRLVLWQGVRMILAGAGIGIVAALAAGCVLQHLVEGMRAAYGASFAVMIPLLILAALLASLFQLACSTL